MPDKRIDALFARCRAENRAALILYLTSGFPDEATTRRLLPILEESGCDLVELGVPFSDPIADGPTIQRASTVALQGGMTFDRTLGILRGFRSGSSMPVILFGACNPFLARGLGQTARMAAEAGADGFLAADVPVEEAEEFRGAFQREGLDFVLLAAPTSPPERLRAIASASSGFLYCIARKGITGASQSLDQGLEPYLARVRQAAGDLPLAVGFGISTPEHARAVAPLGDAVIVGSALISLIEECTTAGRDLEAEVRTYVSSLAQAVRRGGA